MKMNSEILDRDRKLYSCEDVDELAVPEMTEEEERELFKNVKISKIRSAFVHVAHSQGTETFNGTPCAYGACLDYTDENGTRQNKSIQGVTMTENALWCEMYALAIALNQVPTGVHTLVFSDNPYLIDPFAENWIDEWKANDWRTDSGLVVQNLSLWQELYSLDLELRAGWSKGGNSEMEKRAKELADGALIGFESPVLRNSRRNALLA